MVLALAIPPWVEQGIQIYGYWIVLLAVGIESLGIPFPGETSLLAAAVYAATSGRLSIALVIGAAAAGAIIGDNIGFAIGHFGGYPLIRHITQTRFARFVHLDDNALNRAQGYFERHGDKTVFLGRFVSVLRTWVAFLAGLNRMHWRTFLFWNAAGGIVWAIIYGTLGYVLGRNIALLDRIVTFLGVGGVVLAVAAIVGFIVSRVVKNRREHAEGKNASDGNAADSESKHAPEEPESARSMR